MARVRRAGKRKSAAKPGRSERTGKQPQPEVQVATSKGRSQKYHLDWIAQKGGLAGRRTPHGFSPLPALLGTEYPPHTLL